MQLAIALLVISSTAAAKLDITYFLTTPEEPNVCRSFGPENYGQLIFNSTRDYKVLCHGWTADETTVWYPRTVSEYMKKGDTDVISIGYKSAVNDPLYLGAVRNVRILGNMIADMIIDLHDSKSIPYEKFHLIGHSLGAHIAGVAGAIVEKKTGYKVSRITGIDPARPGFELAPCDTKLNKGDADFVDVIHTSQLGLSLPLGDVDFYPNGGRTQTGCDNAVECSHNISPFYFLSSINDEKYVARKCKDYERFTGNECEDEATTLMGDGADRNARGSFYLNVNKEHAKEMAIMKNDWKSAFLTSLNFKVLRGNKIW